MTKQQFLDSLQWVVGQPPLLDDERGRDWPPMVVRLKDGEVGVIGNWNQVGGICDECRTLYSEDIVSYAYLYEDET